MRRAVPRVAAAGSRVALGITVAAVIACLIGVPAWAADAEPSAEQLAELCPKVERLTADDLPEDMALAELRDSCARWTAEVDESPATGDRSVTADPSPTSAPSPTPEPEVSEATTAAAAATARPSGEPSADRPHPTGRSAAMEPTPPGGAGPTESPSADPAPPAAPRTAIPPPPPAAPRAAIPPPPPAAPRTALPPLPPVSAAPEFGLLGFEPSPGPTDLAAAGTATALPSESPTLPRPIVLATLLLAAVGTVAVRSSILVSEPSPSSAWTAGGSRERQGRRDLVIHR